MDNRNTLVISLLPRGIALAAIGVASIRLLDHVIPSFVLPGGGDATALVMGSLKLLGHASLNAAALSRDVLALFGAN